MPYALGASAALTLCLPFLQSGCGSTACLQLTDADHGKCPSANAAFPRFSDPMCPGVITSVNGEASQDGDLCCYPVREDSSAPFPGGCSTGFGGFETGIGGAGGFGETVTGVGGFGTGGVGGSPCSTCAEALAGQVPFVPTALCEGSSEMASQLMGCACGMGFACDASCLDNLCGNIQPTDSCFSCLSTSCATILAACQAD